MVVKASINGPNNRKNRAGEAFSAHLNPVMMTKLPFRIKRLDKLLLNDITGLNLESIGNACIFTFSQNENGSGRQLLSKHLEMTGHELYSSDSPLIHFHDIPIFALRAIPYTGIMDDDSVDCLYLSDVHCHNNKICVDATYDVVCCSRIANENGAYDDYPCLSRIGVEMFLRYDANCKGKMTFHADDVARVLSSHTIFSILTVNECVVVTLDNIEIVCRVYQLCIDSTDETSLLLDEPYCGRVTANTEFFIRTSNVDAIFVDGSKDITDEELQKDVIHITTSDGEWFPVKRDVLFPCIKMTKYVQAGRGRYKDVEILSIQERSSDAPLDGIHCKVPIDCCTFDRCLLFIMSQLFPSKYKFNLDLSETNALTEAAEILGLEALKDLCTAQQSSFVSRVRTDHYIRLNEVLRRNEQNEILIIIDGMVLDITKWLHDHPGGATIIPTQAINIDCTPFFEMYHVSKQSFLYLKQFYIGELAPVDVLALKSKDIKASEGFLQTLRSFTEQWRVVIKTPDDSIVYKSL